MSMLRGVVIVFVLLLTVPFCADVAHAATTSSSFCPTLKRSLSLGDEGDDVAALQRYLIYDGYLTAGNISGTFNAQTFTAVRQWQLAHKVITKDDDESTGAGTVGPKTRAAIAKSCGQNDGSWAANGPSTSSSWTQSSTASSASASGTKAPETNSVPQVVTASSTTVTLLSLGKCAAIARPSTACVQWKGILGDGGCVTAWVCAKVATSTMATSTTNRPPYITKISGPTAIKPNVSGAWSVSAVDPEGGSLVYNFKWINAAALTDQSSSSAFGSSPNISHAFGSTGVYALSTTVRDDAGNTAGAALQITVSSDAPDIDASSTDATIAATGANCTYRNVAFLHATTIKLPECTTFDNTALCGSDASDTMTCNNGHWIVRGTTDACSVPGQTTDPSNVFGCYSGSSSQTDWTNTGSTNGNFPPGSYGGGVVGQSCVLEGMQSFTACPNMANCMGGGTYLTCHNNKWQVLNISSSAEDRAAQLANVLTALESGLRALRVKLGQ